MALQQMTITKDNIKWKVILAVVDAEAFQILFELSCDFI
jgi:hypothetical protein